MSAFPHWLLAVSAPLLLAGCATRSRDIPPVPADPAAFAQWSCEAIDDEIDRVQQRASELAYSVDELSGNNIIALSLGVTVFWPALLAMRPSGPDAVALARLKGRDEALHAAAQARPCPPAADVLAADKATALPIALGERLVYEERPLARGAAREIGLRLVALRRGALEFVPDLGGEPLAMRWQQDAAGNMAAQADNPGWVTWTRLLRREMALGDGLAGHLLDATGTVHGRLRGQVIALGVQTSLGRPFDAAVIELFGEVPQGSSQTRLEGVMVVDRKSGVLLRLELRSGNADFALRRTLVRIEPALPAAS